VDVKAEAERVCSSSSPTVGDDDADEAQEEAVDDTADDEGGVAEWRGMWGGWERLAATLLDSAAVPLSLLL
jgi:hypothetical protein